MITERQGNREGTKQSIISFSVNILTSPPKLGQGKKGGGGLSELKRKKEEEMKEVEERKNETPEEREERKKREEGKSCLAHDDGRRRIA